MSEEEPFKRRASRRMSLQGNMADRRQYDTNSSVTSDEEGTRVIRRKSAIIPFDDRVNFISENEFSDSDEDMELGENADEVDLASEAGSLGSKNSKGSSGSDVRKLTKGLDWKSEEHILESLSDEDEHAYTANDTYSFRDVNKHLIKPNKRDESDNIVKENNVNKRKWKCGSSASNTSTGKTGKLTKTLRATCILGVFAVLALTGYLIFAEHKNPLSVVVAAVQKFEEEFVHNEKSLEPRVLNHNGNYYYVHP